MDCCGYKNENKETPYDYNNSGNYILAEINIDENNINKDIRIINTFEESKRENRWPNQVDDNKKKMKMK